MHFYISSKDDISIANWILRKLNTEYEMAKLVSNSRHLW